MDAVRFLQERARMCNSFSPDCEGCRVDEEKPVISECYLWMFENPERAVKIVEEWSAAHPPKTRQMPPRVLDAGGRVMERLTEKHYLGTDHYMKCSENCNVDMDCIDCPSFDCLVERLAAYEDTGLTPEEFAAYCVFVQDLIGEQKASEALSRFRELLKADGDGRLVVPPCKVGDRLYEVTGRKTISVYKVRTIRVELFGLFIEWDIVEGFAWQSLSGINAGEIGKTVFLTREEAEKALEEMNDGR